MIHLTPGHRVIDDRLETGGRAGIRVLPWLKNMMNRLKRRFSRRKKALAAAIEMPVGPGRLECTFGDIIELNIRVKNLGSSTWSTGRTRQPDFVSYHWEVPTGESLEHEGLRTPLPCPVIPGESVAVRMKVSVTAPGEEAVLAVDMVREGEAWFSDLGTTPLRVPCSISGAGGPGESRVEPGTRGASDGNGPVLTVEELWGERAGVRETGEVLGWLDHSVVLQECILPKLGTPGTNWVLILVEKHGIRKGGNWLSLGCGDGGLELWLARQGVAASIEGVDVSPGAVEIANKAARDQGLKQVNFRTLDLNRDKLPASSYDVILASMAVHHIQNLEKAFESIYEALRPGGYFLASEYVGPTRMQFTGKQVELTDRLISLLPGNLRVDTVASGSRGFKVFKDRYFTRSVEEWEEVDPSEAVRSGEIIPVFRQTFSRARVYPYGGTLMHLALEHIAGNFDPADGKDRAILRIMDVLETELIEAGTLENDFSILVGQRPPVGVEAEAERR